jgi:hypothetical protein
MKQLAWGAAMAAVLALATTLEFPSHAMQSRTTIDVASLGPQVGQQVPDFSLPDQNGRVWTRDSILGPNGAIVLFHRSADW